MTEAEMAIYQRGNTDELRALLVLKDEQNAEKDKTIEWQRKQLEEQRRIANGVDFLVGDRQKTKAANTERGKENQTKGNTEERNRAAADMKIALKRVHDDPNVKAGKHGALMTACRRVCREFKSLTNKKNALGKYEEYAPLTVAGGEPIQPETLAKNYREKYGARKPCRAGASTK